MAKLGPLGSQKGVKRKSQKNERRLAKKLDGFTTPGSGAFAGHKGDIDRQGKDTSDLKVDHFLIELKETSANSMVLDNKHLLKISQEARAVQKYPALLLDLQGLSGLTENEWVCIPLSTFSLLLESIREESSPASG